MRRLHEIACLRQPPLDEMLLAIEAEFDDPDPAALGVLDELGVLVAGIPAPSQVEELKSCVAAVRSRVEPCGSRPPTSLLASRALVCGRAHPSLIAALCVEVGRRGGVSVARIGHPAQTLVGRLGEGSVLVCDPCGPTSISGCPEALRPWCVHQLAFFLLGDLTRAYLELGELEQAARATELRGLLPLPAAMREACHRAAAELRAGDSAPEAGTGHDAP